jgi:HEPN domain-containing protein
MKPMTHEWIAKAEGDFSSALREYRARKSPNYDSACFHAQQCIEKYLKAYLHEHQFNFGKTHDLVQLLGLMPRDLGLECLRPAMALLSSFAVKFRYPGESATQANAREALVLCKAARDDMRRMLTLN